MNPGRPRVALVAGAAFVALSLLAGCQSAPTTKKNEPYRNLYTQRQDSAPSLQRAVDYHRIPDAAPKDEPRSKYGNKSPYTVLGKTYEVLLESRGYSEEGIASWYGEKFHGFRTSSQETYDMYKMTAAHKTLPIPSYVRVTNLDNDRSVIVRVNDRGPFHGGRIIDLSWAAAQKLGYASVGTARVRVEAVEPGAPVTADVGDAIPADDFVVQLGAFAQPATAQELADRARRATGAPVSVDTGKDGLQRVRVGPWPERTTAERMRDRLRDAGFANGLVLTLQE